MNGVFRGVLRCSLPTICGGAVSIVGNATLEPVPEPTGPGYSGDLEWKLVLRLAHPALPLIRVPKGCPEEVNKPLQDAASVIWLDASAAVNRMRVALEALMDVKRVQKWTTNKHGRRERLKLHSRLEKFEARQAASKDFLMAVKALGNEASHQDVIKLEDAFEAAELVEHALELIYDDRVAKLTRRASQIVARKGGGRAYWVCPY